MRYDEGPEKIAQVYALALLSEREKLAGGEAEHKLTSALTSSAAAGERGASPSVARLLEKGSLHTDMGLRHPHLPWNDPRHAFPSLPAETHFQNVARYQQQGAADIARSIAQPSRTGLGLRQQYYGAKGLLGAGEGQHVLQDIGHHLEKPVEEGYATSLGRRLSEKLKGYGGGPLASGREHLRSMKGGGIFRKMKETLRPTATDAQYIDELGNTAADARTLERSKEYGTALRQQVEQRLISHHGHTPEQASQAAERFFTQQHVGQLPELAARARRDASLIKGEALRAVRTAPEIAAEAPGLLRRGASVGRSALLRRVGSAVEHAIPVAI